MSGRLKKYVTMGCCGIDCGLCPRYYTSGDSACPGCGGVNFREKHPSCGTLTCCVLKKGLEVCAECKDYPCERFEPEKIGYDSFVTHKKIFVNLEFIRDKGIEEYLFEQNIRIAVLKDLLTHFNDGRAKSFYCLGCALLPIDKLQEIHELAHSLNKEIGLKDMSKQIKESMLKIAGSLNMELKLNNRN